MKEALKDIQRQNAFLKWMCICVGTLLVAGVLWGFAQPDRHVLEAEGFHVIDDDGKTRAWLGLADGDPELVLLGPNGKPAARLVVVGGVPRLKFENQAGATIELEVNQDASRFTMDAGEGGGAVLIEAAKTGAKLIFKDGNAVARLEMAVDAAENASVYMRDSEKRERLIWQTGKDGANLRFLDESGTSVWSAPQDAIKKAP